MSKRFGSDAERRAAFARMSGKGTNAFNRDASVRAANTLPDTPSNRKEWANNTRRIDLEGVDTPITKSDLPQKNKVVSEGVEIHPYTKSIQGNTLDELQYIYGEQRHEFDTNLANLSKSEQDDLKMRIKLTKQQIEFRNAQRITTDMYKKDLGHGNLTQEQYDKLVSSGTVLSDADYKKALDIKAKEDAVRLKPKQKPEYVPPKYKIKEQPVPPKRSTEEINKEASKMADDWLNGITRDIKKLEKEHGNVNIKIGITDRFKRDVEKGEITVERFNELVKDGTVLSTSEYKKATDVQKQIEDIKNRPIPKPVELQTSSKQQTSMKDSRIGSTADNLKWEAAHPPKELQAPKEYTDAETKNFIWGVSEKEAIDKLVGKERADLTRWVDNQNKDEVRFKGLEKKWTALNRKEQKLSENQELRYQYHSLKKDVKKYSESAKWWQQKINKIDSGEYQKINKDSLHTKYVDQVKLAIKKGKHVPYDVIKQYPEFTKAQNSRERYDKGRHTSFANVSIAVDESKKELHGVKIKLQNGKPMTDKKADQIVGSLSQLQNVIGDITHIMRKENLAISHTSGKHPFLSTFAGVYHPTDKTVTMGMQGVAAHEMAHFIDGAAKEHKDKQQYDYNLLAKAKLEWNGGAKQALSLSKRKDKEQLKEARALKVHLGGYWERPEEIFARLVEQYTAYKNQDLSEDESYYSNMPYKWYVKTPAYWSNSEFEKLVPELETEINRKIKLAETEA